MRSRKTERQIRRNIRGVFAAEKAAGPGADFGALFHVFAVLVAVLLPLSLTALGAEIAFRVPDLMAFEIERGGVLKELGLETTGEAVAEEIAGFLNYKSEKLELSTKTGRVDVPVFSVLDETNLGKIRSLLDRALFPSAGAFGLSILLFIVTRLGGRRRYLRYALRASVVFFVCGSAFSLALALFWPLREAVFSRQPGIEYGGEGVLLRFYGGLYPLFAAVMACLISFLIYIALYGILKRFTKEADKMFS